MNRRQTLGGLSPNQLNVRAGNAPARVIEGKPVNSRKSLAPAKIADALDPRRSSVYGKSASGVKTDPRPIGDKNYMNNCIRVVITYLSSHGYPAAVSPKMLTTPTAKEFTTLVQFLMQKFDPNVKAFGKVEDEVPQFLKKLNYPFQISKSALFAVGSPHSWPAVLAALTWMVELLNYQERAEESTVEAFDEKQKSERDFFDYISRSYRHFLAGEDEQVEAADDAMLQQFRDREAQLREDNGRLADAGRAVAAEVESLRAEPSPLAAAQQRRAEHLADKEKFEALLANLQVGAMSGGGGMTPAAGLRLVWAFGRGGGLQLLLALLSMHSSRMHPQPRRSA